MRVLVTGATGFVGRHLLPRLRDEGEDVVVLARGDAAPLSGEDEVFPAPDDLADLDDFPESIDAVVHLAAMNPQRGTRGHDDRAALMRANRDATVRLAELAAGAGVRRFLFLSTANVHAAEGSHPVIEDDEPAPADLYAASKLSAEDGLRETLAGTTTSFTILRPPPIYGPGGRGGIASLKRLASSHMPLPFAATKDRRSVLAVENLVDAILLALGHPAAANQIFLLADEEPSTTGELVEMMRGATSRGPGLFAMPTALLVLAAKAGGRGALAERLQAPFVVDHSKIRLRLGWRPRLSTREALAAAALGPAPRSAP